MFDISFLFALSFKLDTFHSTVFNDAVSKSQINSVDKISSKLKPIPSKSILNDNCVDWVMFQIWIEYLIINYHLNVHIIPLYRLFWFSSFVLFTQNRVNFIYLEKSFQTECVLHFPSSFVWYLDKWYLWETSNARSNRRWSSWSARSISTMETVRLWNIFAVERLTHLNSSPLFARKSISHRDLYSLEFQFKTIAKWYRNVTLSW